MHLAEFIGDSFVSCPKFVRTLQTGTNLHVALIKEELRRDPSILSEWIVLILQPICKKGS